MCYTGAPLLDLQRQFDPPRDLAWLQWDDDRLRERLAAGRWPICSRTGWLGATRKLARCKTRSSGSTRSCWRYGAAGIKAAMNLLGFDGTHPRRPTPPMPAAEVAVLEEEMRRAGLLGK